VITFVYTCSGRAFGSARDGGPQPQTRTLPPSSQQSSVSAHAQQGDEPAVAGYDRSGDVLL